MSGSNHLVSCLQKEKNVSLAYLQTIQAIWLERFFYQGQDI
jgi:hypothetical protein